MYVYLPRTFFCILLFLFAVSIVTAQATPAVTWHGTTEIDTGRGQKGPWQQNESRYDYVDDPAIAITERGEVAVTWVQQDKKDVFFQRFSPDNKKLLNQPVNVSRTPKTFSWLPRVVIAPDDPRTVYVIWQEIIFSGGSHGGDILFARSDNGGASFSEPINLSDSIGGDGKGRINKEIWHNGSLDLVAGTDGNLYAAWTEYDGPLWFSRSTDGGKSFSRPRAIAGTGDSKPARAPSLALGPDGSVYLAWTVGGVNDADIRVAKSTDGGATYTEPQIIASNKTYSDAPKIAVDGDGTVHLVYAESAGGPFARYRIHYARSSDGAQTFTAPREISTPLPQSVESGAFPALSTDAMGNVYVMFELYPDHRQSPRGLGMTVSRDGGRSFAQPFMVPGSVDPEDGSNGSHQGWLMKKLAANDAGAIAVVNSSLERGDHSRVWMIRGEISR
jgi:hypothetical protein